MPKTVYGGPYLHESEAIIAESRKETPDYDALIKDWDSISQGAEAFIVKLSEGFEKPVGVFVENVKEEEVQEPDVLEELLGEEE